MNEDVTAQPTALSPALRAQESPRRVQLRRTKGWRMPANTVKVSRPGPWGNYAGATRAAFEADLAQMSNEDKAFYIDKVRELRGKNLACWCALNAPCHADVLLEIANQPRGLSASEGSTKPEAVE